MIEIENLTNCERQWQMRHIRMSWLSPARLAAGVIVAAALLAGGSAGASSAAGSGAGPVIGTDDGAVRGMTLNSTEEFLGIPYAAPPTGALRWRPPAPPAPWSGVREAVAFAPHCPQPPSPFGVASTSEDCLYLNVFAPAHANGNLPVMVWIHGGAFLAGESDDYNPAALVRRGVVVVTLNYRLGALGFLADSALASRPGGPSGNYGLMDQQAALRWVQRNIRGFGGNPRDVTIFGQSAGGQSVLTQMASPGARGLFARAIVESGTDELTQAPLATAEAAGTVFTARAGCTAGTPAGTAACLRSLPVSTIVSNEDLSGYQPDVDGAVLPQSVKAALTSGQFNRVPVITGTNHDEYRLFVGFDQVEGGPPVTAANYQAMIASTLGTSAPAAAIIARQYPLRDYPSPALALGAVGTDAIFACPAVAAEDLLSRYVPTYAYEFNDENAPEPYLPSEGFAYGATHVSEEQYLFSLGNVAFPAALTAAQQRLAAAMQRDWTSFAALGFPAALWPRFSSASPEWESLVPPQPRLEADFTAVHQCTFWSTAG